MLNRQQREVRDFMAVMVTRLNESTQLIQQGHGAQEQLMVNPSAREQWKGEPPLSQTLDAAVDILEDTIIKMKEYSAGLKARSRLEIVSADKVREARDA
jgi:hypothetical protein